MQILIVDYGMGNLRSVKRSFEECGANAYISDNPKDILSATHIVIPGVGAFRDGMANLINQGWVDKIKDSVNEGVPTLGICLGMQLLATKSYEGGEIPGMDIISGQVIKLIPFLNDTKIPHIGWNEVHSKQDSSLLKDIKDGADFYFVHSYHFEATNSENIIATTPYCDEFNSIVGDKNVYGVQFHPEKSGKFGFKIIENFINM